MVYKLAMQRFPVVHLRTQSFVFPWYAHSPKSSCADKWNISCYTTKKCSITILFHAIENTANQNTGKPLYTRLYYTQPSHRVLRICRIDCVGQCIF